VLSPQQEKIILIAPRQQGMHKKDTTIKPLPRALEMGRPIGKA